MGWQLFIPTECVSWCGHGQEIVPIPAAAGWAWMVPVLGEVA